MNIKALFSPICAFLQGAWLRLTAVDGKPGLQVSDFQLLVNVVAGLSHSDISGSEKAQNAANWLQRHAGDSLSQWTLQVLVWIAYQYAGRKGMLQAKS